MPQPNTYRSGTWKPQKSGLSGLARPIVFFAQHGARETGGMHADEPVADGRHGLTLVENVVEYQYHAVFDRLGRSHAPLHVTAALGGVPVARQVDVVELEREIEMRQQHAGKHGRAAHDRQQQWELVSDSGLDLARHTRDGSGDGARRDDFF